MLCTPKAELRREREQAIDRLVAAYASNNIPCPREDVTRFSGMTLCSILELAEFWEKRAQDTADALFIDADETRRADLRKARGNDLGLAALAADRQYEGSFVE